MGGIEFLTFTEGANFAFPLGNRFFGAWHYIFFNFIIFQFYCLFYL